MLVINNKKSSFVRTNGHNLWINIVAQELLCNPDFADVEVDEMKKLIIIHKNNKSGTLKVTHVQDKQCKISINFLLKRSVPIKDKTRFTVQGGNGTMWFNF